MKELELIPHAKNLMESTRSVGYSLPAAVADLIDNSIAADARRVRIWTPTESERDLRILDDGRGMDEEGLLAAMRYGSRFVGLERESGDLGRFGLGLKMASLSQCRCLTVVSKQGDRVVGACWDLDHVGAASCEWAVQLLEAHDLEKVPWIEELRGQSTGTLVVWTKLDNMLMGISERGFSDVLMQRLSDLKSHLALVFHRYLQGEGPHSFEIEFNGRLIEPADPFLEGRSQRPFATDSFSFAGGKVSISPYVLPHPKTLSKEEREMAGDLQKDQGFYVYRNKRLVIWGTWFRLSRKLSLSKLARVRVDIPASAAFDRLWSLDVKKSAASVPEELKGALRAVVEKLCERSGKVWTRRARVEQAHDAFWARCKNADGAVSYVVNEANPVVAALIEKSPEVRSFIRLLASRLPLDSLYADLANDKTVEDSGVDQDEIRRSLLALGIDAAVVEACLTRSMP